MIQNSPLTASAHLLETTAASSVLLQSTAEQARVVATQLLGLAVFAGTLAALLALLYRRLSRETLPVGVALIVGLGGVALYLNTTTMLGEVVAASALETDVSRALFSIGAFLAGGVGASAGRRVGDRFSRDVLMNEPSDVSADASQLVRTVGRVTVITLPATVDDVVGYDPVAPETKEKLAGRRFLFPRALTHEQLRNRLVSRLKRDYGVGTVDLELADDGTVEHLAVGSRAAGIGPTLPPATNAVAIRADPAFSASAGDIVQVWETEPMRRLLTAELRGVAGDVVTIAIDAADTPKIDPRQEYRLVTLPVEDRPEREFASLLRAADETFSSVTVEAGSPLHGLPVGAIDLTTIAVTPENEGEPPAALPDEEELLTPGDTLFAIGQPEALRRLETASQPLDPSLVEDVGRPAVGGPPEHSQPAAGQEPAQEPAAASPQEPTAASQTTPEEPSVEPDETPEPASQPATADAGAGESTFDELKAEFESGDPDWEDEESSDEPIESIAGGSGTGDTTPDDAEKTDDASFDELKAEFESGEADWEESADTTPSDDGDDGLVDLDEADISFGDDAEEEPFEDDDDLETFDLEDGDDEFEDDDILDLEDDTEDERELSLDDDEEDDEDEGEDDDDEDEDDDDSAGGGSTFAQLKEEFESGDADWEDDISDSPGGDMRLDE